MIALALLVVLAPAIIVVLYHFEREAYQNRLFRRRLQSILIDIDRELTPRELTEATVDKPPTTDEREDGK